MLCTIRCRYDIVFSEICSFTETGMSLLRRSADFRGFMVHSRGFFSQKMLQKCLTCLEILSQCFKVLPYAPASAY